MNIAPPLPTPGARLIGAERQRQVSLKGWTAEHDDEHEHGQLVAAAIAYAAHAMYRRHQRERPNDWWPWWGAGPDADKPDGWKPSDDPVRNLVKAGALIAAEIDRLQRSRP